MELGIKEGEQKTKEKLAVKLLSIGTFTKKQISEMTDLSLEQVQTLKEK